MNIATHTAVKTESSMLPIVFSAMVGLSILFLVGFASSGMIHDSAHDMRHAMGFACH